MLRIVPIQNAAQAASYYGKSDGGYYLSPDELKREWGGKGAAMLGLGGDPRPRPAYRRAAHCQAGR
jgi:hypothetical protein